LVSRKVHSRRPREDLSSLTAFVLTSKANGASFYVGPFETPSLQELHAQLGGDVASGSVASKGVGLTFENITGAAKTLHLEPSNAGAVFQVASQFNCLEMAGPGTRPDDGVTQYYCDATQPGMCPFVPSCYCISQLFREQRPRTSRQESD